MTIIKKIFLALLSILLVIDINLLVLAISANETILNPEFVEYELERFSAYSKIKEIILGNFEKDGIFIKIINESVTEEWIKEQSHTPIYNFFSYIKSNDEEIDLTVSTLEVKRNILDNLQKDASIPGIYAEQMGNEIRKIPDEINLYDYLDNDTKVALKDGQNVVNYFYLMFYFLIAIAVIIPILSILITKNLKSVIRFIGSSAFMSGLISYGTGILTIDMFSQKFQTGEMPVLEKDIILVVLQDIFEPVKTYGLILLISGIILMILSFFINRRKK